jgi:hypothetical protein
MTAIKTKNPRAGSDRCGRKVAEKMTSSKLSGFMDSLYRGLHDGAQQAFQTGRKGPALASQPS